MKLIKPSFEIWEQEPGLEGIYKVIERAGRVCYKSEDKITEDSAKPFVDRMVKAGHGAMLEHSTVYLKVPNEGLLRNFIDNTPSHFNYEWCRTNPVMDEDNNVYITTNYRHIIEHKLEDYLKYICKPTEFHEKRITVKFILSRSIAQEYTRHRMFSFAMESQRYCAYNRDKFGNEVTFIIPCWLNWDEQVIHRGDFEKSGSGSMDSYIFVNSLLDAESSYLDLVKENWKAQQAREVLPNACKTELIMTGFVSDWRHFFELRCATNAHPQARELAIPLREEFIKRGYITKLE
jgi:thymidylate synthase (FAD)